MRWPPVCGTLPVVFSKSRLSAGSARLTRRPFSSRVRRKWSPSASKPNSDRRKPSLPRAAPWQAPELQPARMKTGITSSLKLTGRSFFASFTATGTAADLPPNSTFSSVAPSASGVRTFFSSRATAGLASVALAWAVTSRVMPSA